MKPKNHDLKIWPEHFAEIISGDVTCQVRKDDRPFKKGDTLTLHEYVPKAKKYTGKSTMVAVTNVLRDKPQWLKRGFCVLSIKLVPGQLMKFDTVVTKRGKRGAR